MTEMKDVVPRFDFVVSQIATRIVEWISDYVLRAIAV